MTRFVIKSKKEPDYIEDGLLSAQGKEIASRYASQWVHAGVRALDLEDAHPDLAELFYEIRVDHDLALEYAGPNAGHAFIGAEADRPGAMMDYAGEPIDAGVQTAEPDSPFAGITTTKSLAFVIPFEKLNKSAGPFIGPRGGKWANAAHTIPWRPGTERSPTHQPAVPTQGRAGVPEGKELKPGGIKWLDHYPGLPKDTQVEHSTDGGKTYKPERVAAVHDPIVAHFTSNAAPVPAGEQKVAFVMMGGPASGKSTIVKKLLAGKQDSFVNVNPDDVKEMMPEYKTATEDRRRTARDAAFMVHNESSDIAEKVLQHAIENGKHLVLDGTGKNADNHLRRIQELQAKGYHVKVVMPDIDIGEAINQVAARAERSGRFVPTDIVQDAHQKIPGNFERIAQAADSFQLFDRRQPGSPLVWEKEDGRETVHDKEFVEEFKKRGARLQEENKKGRPRPAAPTQQGQQELTFGKSEAAAKPKLKMPDVLSREHLLDAMKRASAVQREEASDPKPFEGEPFDEGAGIEWPVDD